MLQNRGSRVALGWEQNKHVPLFSLLRLVTWSTHRGSGLQWKSEDLVQKAQLTLHPVCVVGWQGVYNPQWIIVPSSVKLRVKRAFFVLLIFCNKNVSRSQWNKVLLHLSLLNTLSMHLLINAWFEVSPKIWSLTASTSLRRPPREDLNAHILVPVSVHASMCFNQSWDLWSAWQTFCFSNPLSPLSVHATF